MKVAVQRIDHPPALDGDHVFSDAKAMTAAKDRAEAERALGWGALVGGAAVAAAGLFLAVSAE